MTEKKYICDIATSNGYWEIPLELAEQITTERTSDLSKERKAGQLCRREELDNKPIFKGFTAPMWGGVYGDEIHLRYESWDVYNAISSD